MCMCNLYIYRARGASEHQDENVFSLLPCGRYSHQISQVLSDTLDVVEAADGGLDKWCSTFQCASGCVENVCQTRRTRSGVAEDLIMSVCPVVTHL